MNEDEGTPPLVEYLFNHFIAGLTDVGPALLLASVIVIALVLVLIVVGLLVAEIRAGREVE